MPKVYTGKRISDTECEVTVEEGGVTRPLNPRLDLWNHSPSGLNWGYNGSGPAQLSLALLADCFHNDDDRAVELHQWFKRQQVALWEGNDWTITSDEILRIVSRY
jgi:hypothetical protein